MSIIQAIKPKGRSYFSNVQVQKLVRNGTQMLSFSGEATDGYEDVHRREYTKKELNDFFEYVWYGSKIVSVQFKVIDVLDHFQDDKFALILQLPKSSAFVKTNNSLVFVELSFEGFKPLENIDDYIGRGKHDGSGK